MERITKLILIAIVIAVSYVLVCQAQTLATAPPCCKNLIGTQACLYLNKTNNNGFINRCNTELDFRVIQCCQLCDVIASNTVIRSVPQTYENAVQRMLNSSAGFCFDRMSQAYCKNFVEHKGPWLRATNWSCGTKYAHLAFRICRRSCGYCSVQNSTASSVPLAAYNQFNAYLSCALQ